MSIIIEVDSYTDSASARDADNPLVIPNDHVDETNPHSVLEESRSESSESSYTHIDLDDDIEDQQQNHDLEEINAETPQQSHLEEDVCSSIPGMYRILDLISERGSSGLVDKVIIAQESLRRFLNEISPGSYVSLTKVDFKTLDKFHVKPIGIYGSKAEIVRFLVSISVIDDSIAAKLIRSSETSVENPVLRSGLYICRVSKSVNAVERMYVIYWPEESTWDDDTSPSVRRTFMRYLTKICDQVTALISSDHAKSIVWNNPVGDAQHSESDEDDDDRFFTFEVAKTKEQEERVTARNGFECASNELLVAEIHPDCNEDSELFKPRLLFGETRQGFMTTKYSPVKRSSALYNSHKVRAIVLQDSLLKEHLQISESISYKSLSHLVRLGLQTRFPNECNIWSKEIDALKSAPQKDIGMQEKNGKDRMNEASLSAQTKSSIHTAVVHAVFSGYPTLNRPACDPPPTSDGKSRPAIHPRVAEDLTKEVQQADCNNISEEGFRRSRERIGLILYLSKTLVKRTDTQLAKLVQSVYRDNKRQLQATLATILREIATPGQRSLNPTFTDMRKAEKMLKEGEGTSSGSDLDFISGLEELSSAMPVLQEAARNAKDQAQKYLRGLVDKISGVLFDSARHIQLQDIQARARDEKDRRLEPKFRAVGHSLVQKINSLSESCDSPHTLHLKAIMACKDPSHRDKHPQNYEVSGHRETLEKPSMIFTLHLMHLTREDQHELQLNPNKVPNPRFKESHSFRLPIGFSVSHAQLLERDKIFLVLTDQHANLHLYLDHLNSVENSIGHERGKMLHRDKIGEKFLLTFDESQSMLAVISCEKLQLHIFIHDETRGFTASGTTINLSPWYDDGTTISIRNACFAAGSEELLLVDSGATARVFSLTTMQFRPVSLDLHQVPVDVHSSPDGSCFLTVTSDGASTSIVAYHWNTFGSSEGFSLPITDWAGDSKLTISSLIRRGAVHLLKLNLSAHTCSSVALDITRKVTEFTFREKNSDGSSRDVHTTAHNSLIDCHTDVWTHFPVVPAVQRAIISSGNRRRHSILFVTDRDHTHYATYFDRMVEAFERTSKKPTGDRLNALHISATTFDSFLTRFSPNKEWDDISQFRVGEWIVEILCLIPIHVALARDNRFVPLKDGIYSTAVEKALLGAEINDIVDTISFGWYESIFQSYMAEKPVRVVSSMGEQSVGKSFALNHLVDTSFAGSAMRTTEGVWMSVTPTKDALIVALDFEGVHSIERSVQEDTLLVLFNTAISNLVLFRNNFALSRDIAGLFQSFQSSSSVLEPGANPSLFQSTLVIIIKDVVESDTKEIKREFSLKFQQIVAEEQNDNFLSRLHGGKLIIIPWPVIESRDFYKLFTTLKKRLDQQEVTHKTAGEFLHVMKTLMAKLKANDWGALSQNMAAHRVKLLLTLLPTALAFGMQDVERDIEPLKNLDTDVSIDCPDVNARFFVSDLEHSQEMTQEEVLDALFADWHEYDSRQLVPDTQWAEGLAQYLENLAEMRINHVRAWVKSNLSRFQTTHASVMELERTLESAVIDLKSSVQLCLTQCASCQLLCIQNRLHEGPHDCKTNHLCIRSCEYCMEAGEVTPDEKKVCVMTAGHSGKHVCKVNVHLCGAPCKLRGKSGCLEACAKVTNHEDGVHQCAAGTHACGEPCILSSMTLPDGSKCGCKGRCRISIDIPHETHQCGAQYCPISCQLCKRPCLSHNHLHVLEQNAVHLCGEPHTCARRCDAKGICEIETTPDSIQETFKGFHESFQYTKYSQVARRLKCVKLISPGQLSHEGSHVHSMDPDATHYCQERCNNCQYYCTLEVGHSKEHETSHGSMSNTRWSVDVADEEGFELNGRRYATNDEGAPMMCNLVCKVLGRHVHIDYCRAETPEECQGNSEVQHIQERIRPGPEFPKDYLTHKLFWRRSGFKDPYSREEQTNFTKCDSMCPGPEHNLGYRSKSNDPFCILPLFHAPVVTDTPPRVGYISADGHQFKCKNPESAQQTFHIIFLIDRSKSMGNSDEAPSQSTSLGRKMRSRMNNRLGAVYCALYNFWNARQTACSQVSKRDANTVILHADDAEVVCEHDILKSPDELLEDLLSNHPSGGNCFEKALRVADAVVSKWSDDTRPPVIIFLSDGIADVSDKVVRKLFTNAEQKGKGLSLHAILFGPKSTSTRMERMVTVARDAQSNVSMSSAPSSFHAAPNSEELLQAFLGIAASLRKPRAALM